MSINSQGSLDAQREQREATKRIQHMADSAHQAQRHYQDNLRQGQQHGQATLPTPDELQVQPQPGTLPLVYTSGTPHENKVLRVLRTPYRFMVWLLRPINGNLRVMALVGLALVGIVALVYIGYLLL